ncbi:MAG: DNA-3-methyladenine glycosylase 2 family protein [Gammaproteobacteria bacterium]|nr:DNA-3-methyladenine glycosylase 2 family protein [Gammaproteobacteria bacterium]MDE2345109.1 DNA-3-methyladenine glycosylase 2 family protein [Gammaproteobacteria bacterium]
MELDFKTCEQARLSRDARYDGRFFIGVTSTAIYCRCICPAPSAKRQNVVYFPTAAAAADAGFRPCLRCRPETAPGTPAWNGTSATVSRGLRLISEGALDGDSVETLSARLGVTSRHLDRLFMQHLGASPIAVAQTRRLHFAKQLISDTRLPMAQVALASGYQSIRRFNDRFSRLYGRTPTELRRLNKSASSPTETDEYVFRLAYRPPYDWDSLIGFLAVRAIPGVELVVSGTYRRSIEWNGQQGVLEVRPAKHMHALEVHVLFPDSSALLQIVTRIRTMFDLAADPAVIMKSFQHDALLAPQLKRHAGLRVPGSWDGFELAVRAILGQQVTVQGATTLAGRLVQAYGKPLNGFQSFGLTHIFPRPEALAAARLGGLPKVRANAIRSLAKAVLAGKLSFDSKLVSTEFVRRFTRIRGIGEWTAHYVAMRTLGDPDAFPQTDLGLLRACGDGKRLTPAALLKQAQVWRPWRAYAAMYLWRASADAQVKSRRTMKRRLDLCTTAP